MCLTLGGVIITERSAKCEIERLVQHRAGRADSAHTSLSIFLKG